MNSPLSNAIHRMSAAGNALVRLVDEADGTRRVGYTIHASYAAMTVMTNDRWRHEADGLPMTGYLLATCLEPGNFDRAEPIDRRAILLRIVGRAELSTDRDSLRAFMEHFQDSPDASGPAFRDMEPISYAMLQWSGIECKVLGTFYLDADRRLRFGSDVEDFFAARHMRVLKPGAASLEAIVNFVDPIRRAKAEADARAIGMTRPPESFRIGDVRFTSSMHMAADGGAAPVPVRIFPGDFLGHRTAVLGMTRTGKSNTTKTTVSAVAISAFQTGVAIGQLIFDINGEYSNANNQDAGSSIADVFHDNTVRYRIDPRPGFRDLRVNFYESLDLGHGFIGENLRREGGSLSEDLQTLVSTDLSAPDAGDRSATAHWRRRVSIYRCILKAAGFAHPDDFRLGVPVAEETLSEIYARHQPVQQFRQAANAAQRAQATRDFFSLGAAGRDGVHDVAPEDAVTFWQAVRNLDRPLADGGPGLLNGRSGAGSARWLSQEEIGLLNVLVGRSGKNDAPIRSSNAIRNAAARFHSPRGSDNVAADIYGLLMQGRIVIVDLSVGPAEVRTTMADRIAWHLFERSSSTFTEGGVPPRVVVYVEEAHNLIGRTADLDETWPRIAKEGAKYGISLVYATQEPSSIHPNILANTENFFVTHLNNDDEIRALSRYYDFAEFGEGLKRCQDVGFARIKTLSSNFTTPTQVLLFDPAALSDEYERAKATAPGWFVPLRERA